MIRFADLVCYDAASFPTGQERTFNIPATFVAMEGRDADRCPWTSLKCTIDGVVQYVRADRCTYPAGTTVKGFTVTEFGRIGRRSDNKFHPEDALTSNEKFWSVTEVVY